MHANDHDNGQTAKPGKVPPRPAPDTGGYSSSVEEVLELQRSVGNAAATRLLTLSRRVAPTQPDMTEPTTVHEVLDNSPGERLDPELKADAEAKFGRELPDDVRVHTGSAAAESAADVGALAYTSDTDVVVGAADISPEDMYHELWHVVQQQDGDVPGTDQGNGLKVSSPGDSKEKEAAEVGRWAAAEPSPHEL